MILLIRTDGAAEISLMRADGTVVSEKSWVPGRELSVVLLLEIEKLLRKSALQWRELKGIVFYEGPGSYTALRIGASVANALGSSLLLPVAAVGGEDWKSEGCKILNQVNYFSPISPVYGGNVRVTTPKK